MLVEQPSPLQLKFSFSGIKDEIQTMRELASRFITPQSASVLREWQQQLEGIQANRPQKPQHWCISPEHPIETIPSQGQYERGARKAATVRGVLTAKWTVLVSPVQGKKSLKPERFLVVGIASTKIQIYHSDGRELARWRFEIGLGPKAPGCRFHTQVLGENSDTVFPKLLPVPRLPSILVTPMESLDFLLGELFQDDWHFRSTSEAARMAAWGNSHRERVRRLLNWHLDAVCGSSGSAWTAIKKHTLNQDALVEGSNK